MRWPDREPPKLGGTRGLRADVRAVILTILVLFVLAAGCGVLVFLTYSD
jgi:hypothetical protein